MVSCGGGPPTPVTPPSYTDTTPAFQTRVPTNLVFLSIDTYRRDYAGRYGQTGLTPYLDTVAETGVALDDHTTCANWTLPGITCTITGRDSEDNGMIPALSASFDPTLPEGMWTLAGELGRHGFYSVAVSGNPWFSDEWGSTQGFDISWVPETNAAGDNMTREGLDHLEWAIDEGLAERWFLHIHMIEPHSPYLPPKSYLDEVDALEPISFDLAVKSEHYAALDDWELMSPELQDLTLAHLESRYRAEISWTDEILQRAMSEIDQRGLLHDTLVVIWTDHGEQFFEHGNQTHAHNLYREENDGVAVFWSHSIRPESWPGPTTSIDLAPTVLELYDIDIPDGVTGIPLGQAPDDRARFAMASARQGTLHSVRRGDDKLIYRWDGTVERYDLATDHGEQVDLYTPGDATAAELWDLLLPQVLKAAAVAPFGTPVIPEGLPGE